ncbi:MAG TPA: ferritin-like domain-containing protein [Acidimicrobiales bacterium]|nr:ferritin-like domain-containing protein [Acidimicrobiales bacterium]
MNRKALIQVLGAVAYGELKAYEGAKADAAAASNDADRRHFKKVAAEELRHHKGFVARLEALGADPERAMRPYRTALDRYHSSSPDGEVENAVGAYLGEGIADDLLQWLRTVVDAETAAFIDTVIADEVEHEGHAAAALRDVMTTTPGGKKRAAAGAQQMALHMLWSGRGTAAVPLAAFLRLGNPGGLVGAIAGGHVRRMQAIGLRPLGLFA